MIGIATPVCAADGLLAKHAVDACPPDPEPASDRRRAQFIVMAQPQNFAGVNRRLAALIDTARLRSGDPFELPLAPQIGLVVIFAPKVPI